MHASITNTQARHLAAFVSDMRHGLGYPEWDIPGIVAALSGARNRGPVDELAIALVRLARREDLHSPKILAEDGPHWRDLEQAARTIRPADLKRCEIDGHERALLPCRLCASEAKAHPDEEQKPATHHTDPEHLAIYERGARRARAAIKQLANGEVR